jgi:hypothetical protein
MCREEEGELQLKYVGKIMDIQQLARLNSMTKYPSILTYHQLGERGKLDEHIQIPFEDDEDVFVTEKVDGTNARIIFLPNDDYIIGSREEFLHAKGDRIWPATEGIVDAIQSVAERGYSNLYNVVVVFGEVFGGKTGSPKNYTAKSNVGYRVFDVMTIPRSLADDITLGKPMHSDGNWTPQTISLWRQHGGQQFETEAQLLYTVSMLSQEVTPRLAHLKGKDIPKTHNDMLEWLQQFAKTKCRLDDGANAKSEGVVIRNADRSRIAKIRFEDYERTLRPQKPPMKKGNSK